jgi:hypothetical protein
MCLKIWSNVNDKGRCWHHLISVISTLTRTHSHPILFQESYSVCVIQNAYIPHLTIPVWNHIPNSPTFQRIWHKLHSHHPSITLHFLLYLSPSLFSICQYMPILTLSLRLIKNKHWGSFYQIAVKPFHLTLSEVHHTLQG